LARFEGQPDLDPDQLVFLDETATNTKMAHRYRRAPRSERCRVSVPFGHWKTVTVTAGLRASGLTATGLLDEPMTGTRFRCYVEESLVPTLKHGDAVVLDKTCQPTKSAASASPSSGWRPAALPACVLARIEPKRTGLCQAQI